MLTASGSVGIISQNWRCKYSIAKQSHALVYTLTPCYHAAGALYKNISNKIVYKTKKDANDKNEDVQNKRQNK